MDDQQEGDGRILPSKGFAKLDSGIVDSSLWMQDDDFLRVWIALLAKSDNLGMVRASESNFAHLCRITVERLREIIRAFEEPDDESRTPDNEGRRIKSIPGGWCILNYVLYRDMAQRKGESHAARQKRYRERLKERNQVLTGSGKEKRDGSVTRDVEAEADTEVTSRKALEGFKLEPLDDKSLSANKKRLPAKSKKVREKERIREITHDACSAYNEIMTKPRGLLPRVTPRSQDEREKQVAKIVDVVSGICVDLYGSPRIERKFWTQYFESCASDPFLSGKRGGGKGHENWKPDFEYLVRKATVLKVYENAVGNEEDDE